ncbi:MAG: hypothetical protein AAFV19_14435 [Pseudomonadota bacterium]
MLRGILMLGAAIAGLGALAVSQGSIESWLDRSGDGELTPMTSASGSGGWFSIDTRSDRPFDADPFAIGGGSGSGFGISAEMIDDLMDAKTTGETADPEKRAAATKRIQEKIRQDVKSLTSIDIERLPDPVGDGMAHAGAGPVVGSDLVGVVSAAMNAEDPGAEIEKLALATSDPERVRAVVAEARARDMPDNAILLALMWHFSETRR